jgi:hypothetical protein
VNETFYCFWKARRVILSESTLSISAVLLGKKKKDLIVPNFLLMPHEDKKYTLQESPYFSEGESNKVYIMKTLEDYNIVKNIRRNAV